MKVSASNVRSGKGSCSARPATSWTRALLPGLGDVAAALRQHLHGQIHADDVGRRSLRQLERNPGRPGGHVEHRPGDAGTM